MIPPVTAARPLSTAPSTGPRAATPGPPDGAVERGPVGRLDLPGDGAPIVCAHRADVGCAGRAPVTHEYAAIAFHTDGRARFAQRGEVAIEAGDVLLVPAGEPHRRLSGDRPAWWGLALCVPCFGGELGDLLAPLDRVRAGGSPVVRIPSGRHSFLEELFRELGDATAAERRAPLVVQRSLLALILHEIAQASAAAPGPAPTVEASGDLVADSLRFIERNCLSPIRPADVARAVHRSAAHVTTALTRATGRSAGAWIVAGRMAEARRLLLHGDERVDIIAERVGYTDPTHFIRTFRREHGATPAAWRASARAGARPAP